MKNQNLTIRQAKQETKEQCLNFYSQTEGDYETLKNEFTKKRVNEIVDAHLLHLKENEDYNVNFNEKEIEKIEKHCMKAINDYLQHDREQEEREEREEYLNRCEIIVKNDYNSKKWKFVKFLNDVCGEDYITDAKYSYNIVKLTKKQYNVVKDANAISFAAYLDKKRNKIYNIEYYNLYK